MHRNNPSVSPQDLADVAGAFASIDDRAVMAAFLNEILSPTERANVAMRWKLLRMLRKGVPQRTIAARLGVSLCKITRGSRILKNPTSVSRSLLTSR